MSYGYVSCDLNECECLEDELFKITAVFYYASKYKKNPVFYLEYNRNMYNYMLNTMSKSEYDNLNFTIVKENNNDSYTEFEDIEGNVFLEGNFTSLNYFTSHVKNKMVNIIYSYEDYMFDAYTYYENIKTFFAKLDKVEIADDDMISIYVNIDNYKLLEYKKEVETITRFLAKARENNKKYVALFSNDIKWCKEFIKDDYVYFVETHNDKYNPEEYQFIILSFFKNNILYNHNYSLYASLINSFKEKLLISCDKDTNNIIVQTY
jgi:hypothetical protein